MLPRATPIEIDMPPLRPGQRYPKDQPLLVTGEVTSRMFVLKTGRVRARRYDLLGHLAPIVEQVISSLKWDSSQAGRPRGAARAARPRPGLRRNAPYSDRKRGICSCERFRSRLKQIFAEKIPLAMRKDVARHIEPDRIEPKALHP
jgi:hypothetical protein